MEDKNIKFSAYMLLGSALFGLFFGAGNIIFPVQIGQLAGQEMIQATLGFLLTAAGLPFLGILALARSETTGVYELASRVGRRFSLFFTLLLYLTIGPFFALPRTASVAYEIAIASYLPADMLWLVSFIFTFIFFSVAFYFALKPQKIMDVVGKYLNPLFLMLLGIVVLAAIVSPMGNAFTAPVSPPYDASPLLKGTLNGYDTMDGLAALAFGVLVIAAVKNMGVTNRKSVARSIIISGVVVLVLMGIIYTSLVYIGASSTGIMPVAENGGLALAQVTNHYFGMFGALVLALIVSVACLKTAIGLITACSEMFHRLFPRYTYRQYIVAVTAFAFFVANFGLTTIIEYAKPVLMFIYPLSIALIILALTEQWFHKSRVVYRITILCVLFASMIDFVATLGAVTGNDNILHIGLILQKLLPFSDLGLSWVFPLIIGFGIGLYVHTTQRNKKNKRLS
jgi:LIVCS family branched-chain amino acid:cation transporter